MKINFDVFSLNKNSKYHHPFCNYFSAPRKGCKSCKELYKKYPINKNISIKETIEKYFPNIIIRPKT